MPLNFWRRRAGCAPEALNAIDVMCALHELVLTMTDSKMLGVPDINQAVVTAPTVAVDDRVERDATTHNGLQSALFAVRHDLGVNASGSFEDAEDDGLARGPATSLASHATSAEVTFIYFDLARGEGRSTLAFFGDALSDFEKDHSDTLACQAGKFGCLTGRQIERKTAHELTEFTFANFGTPIITV